MTPARLDPAVVEEKLELMRELLDDLAEVAEITPERLHTERLTRHAVERILTQLVELTAAINTHVAAALLGRVPARYRDSFGLAEEAGMIPPELAAALAPSAGLRNVLTHRYGEIDLALVAEAARHALEDHRAYVATTARWLLGRDGDPA